MLSSRFLLLRRLAKTLPSKSTIPCQLVEGHHHDVRRISSLTKKASTIGLQGIFTNEVTSERSFFCSMPNKFTLITGSNQFHSFSTFSFSTRSNFTDEFLNPVTGIHSSVRNYAKGKDKGKGGKGKSHVNVTNEEMSELVSVTQMMHDFDSTMDQFRDDLVKVLAIRTNVGSLEELPIELEGDTFPLNELAQVHRKSTHLLVINCAAFPQASKSIMTAINNSGMNLNPQQEGYNIAVPLPKVTREHREGLSIKAKQLCNKCKESLRLVHNTYVKKVKAKEDSADKDLLFRVVQKIKELQDERVKEAEAMLKAKQAELLKA